MNKNQLIPQDLTEFLIYKTANGDVKVDVYLYNENIWLNQKSMAMLFDVDRSVITKHLKNIFENGELEENSVGAKIAHTAPDGKTYQTKFYNLDAIIAVGYRVNSTQATQFRIWATKILKEYIIKGFVMDDEKLKNSNNPFGKDYFDEQLERIRDIRSSERRFYQKITDIYSQCSIDYDIKNETTQEFFATVQNKLHWAITGKTAAEIVYNRADNSKQNMGLKTWKNAPKGKIRKTDIAIAKNYLEEYELDNLNRIVSMYLDYAELQAKNQQPIYMKNWADKLDAFLQFNEKDILQDKGKISTEVAKKLAETEFEKYKKEQDKEYISDFDMLIKKLKDKNDN